jgi:hypothetical protein
MIDQPVQQLSGLGEVRARAGEAAAGQEGRSEELEAFGVPRFADPDERTHVDGAAGHQLGHGQTGPPRAPGHPGQPGCVEGVVFGVTLILLAAGGVQGPIQHCAEISTGQLDASCRWVVYHWARSNGDLELDGAETCSKSLIRSANGVVEPPPH